MKVKRYKGSSLEKIRSVIVKELGENAVIVNIKEETSKKGLLSGSVTNYEVIAAIEEPVNADGVDLDQASGPAYTELLQLQKDQFHGIRSSMKMLDQKLAEVDERMGQFTFSVKQKNTIPQLTNIHEDWHEKVVETLQRVCDSEDPSDEDWHEALASIMPTAGGIMFRATPASAPDVYVLAGPTGVGKTTTLAKLAARAVLTEHLEVGLITTDTYRIAAVDQLREYASLLGIEIAVAFSGRELKQQLHRFQEKDIVFIDTPGRGQYDQTGINGIAETLSDVDGLCVLLTAPANIRQDDVDGLVKNYGILNPSALVITKTDEASRCDGITKLVDYAHLPVIYLTDGQRVPEDIHVASPGLLASLVIPHIENGETIRIGEMVND